MLPSIILLEDDYLDEVNEDRKVLLPSIILLEDDQIDFGRLAQSVLLPSIILLEDDEKIKVTTSTGCFATIYYFARR